MGKYSHMKKPRPATGLVIREVFTEADWDDYFECREKYDRPVSKEEIKKIVEVYKRMVAMGRKKEALKYTSQNVPLQPNIAMSGKQKVGLKGIRRFNLYEAKKEYPEEF